MSMVNGSHHYQSANSFRRAIEDRLKQEAKLRNRPLGELRREFLFQRFLALIFSDPNGDWVLKGGAGLHMRLEEARSSKDLDLIHLNHIDPSDAVAELQELTTPHANDHITFTIGDPVVGHHHQPMATIPVACYIGAKYERFPIDLATELHLLAPTERIQPRPVIEILGPRRTHRLSKYLLRTRWHERCVNRDSAKRISKVASEDFP